MSDESKKLVEVKYFWEKGFYLSMHNMIWTRNRTEAPTIQSYEPPELGIGSARQEEHDELSPQTFQSCTSEQATMLRGISRIKIWTIQPAELAWQYCKHIDE